MQTELNYDTVFDAQQHFRLLLDSMSRPGKINTFPASEIFPPEGFQPATALTAFALLNNDVTFYVAGDNASDINEYILINTGSQSAEIAAADYIFLPVGYYSDELNAVRTGSAIYPEDSATIIAQTELISEEPMAGSIAITLKGPGVQHEAKVYVTGIDTGLLDFAKAQNEEYPLGIDLIITDKQNNIIGIPRSNRFTFV